MSPVPGTTTELPFCSIPKNLLTKDSKKEEKEKRRKRKKKEKEEKTEKERREEKHTKHGTNWDTKSLGLFGIELARDVGRSTNVAYHHV